MGGTTESGSIISIFVDVMDLIAAGCRLWQTNGIAISPLRTANTFFGPSRWALELKASQGLPESSRWPDRQTKTYTFSLAQTSVELKWHLNHKLMASMDPPRET